MPKSQLNRLLRNRLILLLSAVACFAIAYFISGKSSSDFGSALMKFENVLHEKEQHAKKELERLAEKAQKWSYHEIFSEKSNYYESLFEQEGLVFLIFENDSLRFWTDNTVAVDNHISHNDFNGKVTKLPNGWFGIERHLSGNKKLFALILLKREYAYQNRYLTNEFQQDFNLDVEVEIVIEKDKVGQRNSRLHGLNGEIYERKGDYLCTLVFPPTGSPSLFILYLAIILNLLGFIFSVCFLQSELNSLSGKIGKVGSVFLLMIAVFILRYLTIEIDFPKVFYDTELFSPALYGDASYSWLGSLGDLLINAVLVFYLVYYGHKIIFGANRENPASAFSTKNAMMQSFVSLLPFVLLFIVFFCSRAINYVFAGLIRNSNIPFTLNDVFSQNIYTYLSLAAIGLFFISYFLLLDIVAGSILKTRIRAKHAILLSLALIVLFVAVSDWMGTVDLILVFWPVLLFAQMIWIKRKRIPFPFFVIVILLFVVSFFSAHVVLKYSMHKERDNREVFAEKLAEEQDPLAEHLFTETEALISRDTSLTHLLFQSTNEKEFFSKRLLEKYFSGYWEKYDIRVSVFDTTCYPLISGSVQGRDNLAYFEEVIRSEGSPTESGNLFYLTNSQGRISYLARLSLVQKKGVYYHRVADLFLEFDSRIGSDDMGFPELLLDRKLGIAQELLDYSYAKYKNKQLVTYHGKFPYSLTSELFSRDSIEKKELAGASFMKMENYDHLLYAPDKESLVVISKKSSSSLEAVTTFSYLFAFFSLFLLLLLLLRVLAFERKIRVASFRGRIQYVLVAIVLVSLFFFGGGTIYYIVQQYEEKNLEAIREKTQSVLIELEGKLGSTEELRPGQQDYTTYLLKKFSMVFFTDINMYSRSGDLLASSVSKLFDEGILSEKMSSEAYYEMAVNQKLEFISKENIGNLNYLSAYIPFKNDRGEVLAFLNLPYFSKQSELEKEISTILAAIINIYVLLFVLSVIVAIIISDYVTKPLKLIQEKFSKINLGKANEPIEWRAQDEIGSLVNEYNRMIDKLQKSVELLAKSERETAWREMAKQVAHEIKNPLTPMKLSIQHLQRMWKNKDEDMDKKIEHITQMLIEQIEALSNIASEFSSFAKMPASVSEKVNMKSVLENCISLFKDSADMEFSFDCSPGEALIYADKEQMLRVCNNLLKNAIQSIPENRKGKIEVSLTKTDNSLLMRIKDNGTGIAQDTMGKIFTPNFTTKTGGMGLGLAMVKSIVETFNGKIWFETSRGNGTTFFVSLPEYQDAAN